MIKAHILLFSMLSFVLLMKKGCKEEASSNTTDLPEVEAIDNQMKTIEFGFNAGYVTHLKQWDVYQNPLAEIQALGVNRLRVYEPFTKSLKPHLQKPLDEMQKLTDRGFDVMLTMSNYPYVADKEELKRLPQFEKISRTSEFTNRSCPKDLDHYRQFLTDFIAALKSRGMFSKMRFEIGNELDSPSYFWSKLEDGKKIIDMTLDLLREAGAEVYCCGFTNGVMTGQIEERDDYYRFIKNELPRIDGLETSFHIYLNALNDARMEACAGEHIKGSSITEFNIFSGQKEQHVRKQEITNSTYFVNAMVSLLSFTYEYDIEEVYLFKLLDLPNTKGRLGFFDSEGQPKNSFHQFKLVYEVVKDGYRIEKTDEFVDLIGQSSAIRLARADLENLQVPDSKVRTRSAEKIVRETKLKKSDWIHFDL